MGIERTEEWRCWKDETVGRYFEYRLGVPDSLVTTSDDFRVDCAGRTSTLYGTPVDRTTVRRLGILFDPVRGLMGRMYLFRYIELRIELPYQDLEWLGEDRLRDLEC